MKFLLLTAFAVIGALAENEGNIIFAANVYRELGKIESGNFLVSPLSASIILALVRLGARGNTAKQMSEALQLPKKSETIEKHMLELLPHLQGSKDFQLKSANKVYIRQGFTIKNEFKEKTVNIFKAEIESIDFDNPTKAAKEINNWVEEHTNHKIKNLVDPNTDSFDDLYVLLINALYFHGKWITQFDKHHTQKRNFIINNEKTTKIDMMKITSKFEFHHDSVHSVKYLEMPYEGHDVTMTFILPDAIEGLSALEKRIVDVLALPPYRQETVEVTIPKFKIETKIKFIPILKSLGMIDAFTGNANFSGISSKHLYISEVIQKTFIEVDEEGTTAATATAVFMKAKKIAHHVLFNPPMIFTADHPFIFYLKNKAGILFIGRYAGKNE